MKIFVDGTESTATMVMAGRLAPGDFYVPLAVLDRTNSIAPRQLRRVETIKPTPAGFVDMAYDHPYLISDNSRFERIFSETMFVYRLESDQPWHPGMPLPRR